MRISDWSSDVCASDLLGPELLAVDTQCIVGTVADVEMAFRRSLHVGADAAEPQQLYLRLQQALDELARRHAVLGDAEALLHLRGDLDRLGAALEDTRSEEHTSELQSLMRISYAVFCLKKKN